MTRPSLLRTFRREASSIADALAVLRHAGHVGPEGPHAGHEPAEGGEGGDGGGATTKDGYKAITDRESEIRGQDFESARIVGADGSVLADIDGESHTVGFTKGQVKSMKNSVVTHNHPNGWSFTETDVNLAVKADMAEMRAVSKDKTYIMRRPEKGWPKPSALDKIFGKIGPAVEDRMWTKLRNKEITASQADQQHYSELWNEFANETGATYIEEGS